MKFRPCFFALLYLFYLTAFAERIVTLPEKNLKPFIQKYCSGCHGAEKQKAKVRLDNLSLAVQTPLTAQHWQDVLDTLNAGDMPPEKKEQPSTEELSLILRDLTEGLKKARIALSDQGKKISMRRLNRREYSGAIKHLFGFGVNQEDIPEDDPTDSYDTIGSQQFYSANHFEMYFTLAKKIVAQAFKPRRKLKSKVIQPEKKANSFAEKVLRERMQKWDKLLKLWSSGKTWKEHDFSDGQELYFFAREHANESKLLHHYIYGQKYSKKAAYLSHAHHHLATVKLGYKFDFDPRGEYKVELTAGIHKSPPESRKFIDILASNHLEKSLKVTGTFEQPSVLRFTHKPLVGQWMDFIFREKRNLKVQDKYYKHLMDRYGETASLYIDKIIVEGPYYDQPSFFEKLIYGEAFPSESKRLPLSDENSKRLIRQFAFEACYRQALDESFINNLMQLYQSNRDSGLKPQEALIEPLATVLSSPSFVYISEPKPEDSGIEMVTSREFAVRLANFLWSSYPDEELYGLAESGDLWQNDILLAQVDRMLLDPKAKSFVDGFMGQWFKLKRLDEVAVNPKLFPQFDRSLALSARHEPVEFFDLLLKENLPITNLVDSDFLVVDQVLAHHYGLPILEGNGFRKIQLPENSKRGGLLSSAAFLIMSSTGDRTSPIVRGALIMDKFLNDEAPPPPPNVPELKEASKEPLSVRTLIELHQQKAQCSSCHAKIDPIGYGLENYDAIGRWRDHEIISKKKNVAIQTQGKLPSGQKFQGADGLKKALLGHRDDLASSLVEALFSYGLGRHVSFSDHAEIESLLQELKEHDYQARTLIYSLVKSQSFQSK